LRRQLTRRTVFLFLLLFASSGLVLLSVLLPEISSASQPSFQEGSVAQQDIVAPYALVFDSQVQTQKQRDLAAAIVLPIYSPQDTTISRQQLEHLRSALLFISTVRDDDYATPEQKTADLSALEDIRLSRDTMEKVLSLSETRWQAVQQESIVVLEQVMRQTIYDSALDQARQQVPTLISLSLPEEQSAIVAELVTGFIAPNSFYDEDLTKAAQQQARDNVPVSQRSYAAGETIVQRGQVITSLELEALQQYKLAETNITLQKVISAILVAVAVVGYFMVYLQREQKLFHDLRGLLFFVVLFLIFLTGARLMLPGHIILPYFYPTIAFSLTVSVLYGREIAFIATIPLVFLEVLDLPRAFELTTLTIFCSFFGIMTLRRAQRVTAFIKAGAAIAVSATVIVLLFRLPEPETDWIGLVTLCAAVLANGVASAGISLLLQFFLAQILGMTTPLQLVELSRPDHPLLQMILRNAPGTYQHSLQLANLVEQAAERIGADPLLSRVGALYHDVGKAVNPFFFIENQPPGEVNPHHDLDPLVSSQTIVHHVSDGIALARKYHLPRRIQDFILEHHGKMLTRYQYAKALEAAGGDESLVNKEDFRYPGPSPQSRETALLMLADGCEARVRSARPKDDIELRNLIQNYVDDRLRLGELRETNLTLRDLEFIVDSFVATLRGVYHPRIEYPQVVLSPATQVSSSQPINQISPVEIPGIPRAEEITNDSQGKP
jgi:putative nucleotidyltransferase with HDIG domain